MILPISLLLNLMIGLFSLAILILGSGLLYRAWHQLQKLQKRDVHGRNPEMRSEVPLTYGKVAGRSTSLERVFSDSRVASPLIVGLALLLFTVAGRHIVHLGFPAGSDEPRELHSGTIRYLQQPDGTTIHTEVFGKPDAPTLVFTHGWGVSDTEWYYAKRDLADHFRLIFWDLPGLGQSAQPEDRNFSLERMAADLNSVLLLANGKPVVLVGHSIGGMINLTFCRLFPDRLGHQVVGIAQVDTSYTNPVTTTKNASLSRILQKPVAEPLLHAMVWFSPFVRVFNWLSYENGASHLMNAESAFGGSETWGQLDLISRYGYESSPAVVARGTLAMFHWDATPILPRITVPVLLLVGQQDTTTLPSASEYMQQTIPQARIDIVSPSAHYGLLEQNARYDSSLQRFATACLK